MNPGLLLGLLLVVLIALFFVLWLWRRAEANREAFRTQKESLAAELTTLAPYRVIVDATGEAARLRQQATDDAAAIRQEATRLRQNAEQEMQAQRQAVTEETERLLSAAQLTFKNAREQADATTRTAAAEAKSTVTEAKDRAEGIVRSAQATADDIVKAANKRAEDIAGSAIRAAQDAGRFENAVKALKHIIEGYGDKYVIPSRSLIDDLAEEYGFSQAGEDLKRARERTRAMVVNKEAATCDYVEQSRRDTAIRFVVDAFNGKVDSILSRVKDDNVGTLQQQIQDAFHVVNVNGSAFRSTRILDKYLDARLRELRLAATVQELKLRDREEQRRIKEQLRDEERARREFERSMKEAAKEEETLRKAMEKVQAQVDKATEAQRQKFEAQYAELQERLRQAEARNQRAKSMAEQTKMGHVYIISNIGSFGEDVFKIGLTRRLDPEDRVRELGDASVPFSFDVHAMIFHQDAPALERALHKHFLTAQVNKVNPRKEFFRSPLGVIRAEIEKLGLSSAKWTMTAEAREYRETLAIEKVIADNPAKRNEWLKTQSKYDPALVRDEDDEEDPSTWIRKE